MDNVNAIDRSTYHLHHYKSKLIDIRYCFIHDLVEDKIVSSVYVIIKCQIVDILTKPSNFSKFESLKSSIGLCIMC